MADFQIMSPKLGIAENVPGIFLREAFMRTGSVNVHERYDEYRKIRGRLAELYDITNSDKIACPTDVFTITGINTGTKTITITGDHSGGNTALAAGATIRINGHSTTANNVEYTVASLPTTSTIVTTEAISNGTAAGYVFVGATPAIRYHRHVKQKTGAEYLLLGTGYNIFLWNYTARSLAVKHTCASVCTRWEIVTHKDADNDDNVYATNNVDKVLWWNVASSVANDFAVLDDASNGLDIDDGTTYIVKAKHITSFQGSLIIGYLTYSTGSVHANRIAGAAIDTGGSQVDFQYDVSTSDSWKKDFTNTPAFLQGFAKSGNNIIVGTGPGALTGRMYRGWLTNEATPFKFVEEPLKVGVLAPDTFCNSKDGRLFWLATDMTIRELNTPTSISDRIDVTVRGLNVATDVIVYAQATFIDRYNSVALAVPTGSSETNNKLLMIDVDKGSWFIQDMAIRCFGDYTQQAVYTYATLPYDTYDEWGAGWLIYDTDVNILGFPLDMASDYSGYSGSMFRAAADMGTALTGAMIFATSLDKDRSTLNRKKRINNGGDFYFNTEADGEVTVEVKRDHEASWQSLGTVALTDSNSPEIVVVHLPFDVRAKFFEFKLSSSDYFELIGFSFSEFELEGTR